MAAIGNPKPATRTAASHEAREFVVTADAAAEARAAARALARHVGVTLAGASQPAARIVQRVVDGRAAAVRVLGTALGAAPANAALANGTARTRSTTTTCASSRSRIRARRSCRPRCGGRAARRVRRALLDAYVVGFELEGRLGRVMNRGTISAAGTAPRRSEPSVRQRRRRGCSA
jgi:2-methylcitrate dehydratase PrpD